MEEKKIFPACQASFRIEHLLPRKDTQQQDQQQQPDHFHTYPMPLTAMKPCGTDSGCLENGVANGCSQVQGARTCDPANKSGTKRSRDSIDESGDECKKAQGYSYDSTANGTDEDDDDQFRKRKKARTAFSREQVSELEKKFTEKKYLSSAERGELAERLKLSDMQVKTWFQNRRMKYKRQTEEAEMEMKSPKYPYGSFLPYGGMSPFYSYMQMQYKPENSMNVNYATYPTTVRAAQAHGTTDSAFQSLPMSSPTMISGLSAPLSMSSRHPSTSQFTRPAPTGSYFTANGMLTPISPSNSYQQGYNFAGADHTLLTGHAPSQMHFGCNDWTRAVHGSPTP